MNCYVIMKKRPSYLFITEAKAHEVYQSRQAAVARTKALNASAMSNKYWVVRVPYVRFE